MNDDERARITAQFDQAAAAVFDPDVQEAARDMLEAAAVFVNAMTYRGFPLSEACGAAVQAIVKSMVEGTREAQG